MIQSTKRASDEHAILKMFSNYNNDGANPVNALGYTIGVNVSATSLNRMELRTA